ncbi:hypothetical protein LTR41_012138, partial [Exophiala xenobiotica]
MKRTVKGKRASEIGPWVAAQDVTAEVTPSWIVAPSSTEEGFACPTTESCGYLQEKLQRHCGQEYGVDTR